MRGLLEQLGQGLRGAGAIFSDDVYKGQQQEERIAQQLQAQQKQLMAQQVIKAAETGAIPPEQAKQALGQLFPGMEVPVGPDAATQQRQEEIKRRQAIAQSFGQLAPEDRANPLKIAEVFMANGDHERGAQYINAAETRQARQETLVANLAQREQEARIRSEDRAADRASREQAAREANALRAQIAQGQQALQRDSLELRRVVGQRNNAEGGGGKAPAGYRWKEDGSLEPIPGGPATAKGAGGKPPSEIQRMSIALGAMEKSLDDYETIMKKFDPRSWNTLSPTKRAEISSALASTQLEWKEAAALGALTGPDLQIMEKVLISPVSPTGIFYGKDGIQKQINEARAYARRRKESIEKHYPGASPAAATSSSSGGWSIKEK